MIFYRCAVPYTVKHNAYEAVQKAGKLSRWTRLVSAILSSLTEAIHQNDLDLKKDKKKMKKEKKKKRISFQ
jgi:predicted phage tail protein